MLLKLTVDCLKYLHCISHQIICSHALCICLSCRDFMMAPSLQLYCVESLHLLGHPVTAAVLWTVVKEIHCTIFKSIFILFWFACEEVEHSGMFSVYTVAL